MILGGGVRCWWGMLGGYDVLEVLWVVLGW